MYFIDRTNLREKMHQKVPPSHGLTDDKVLLSPKVR